MDDPIKIIFKYKNSQRRIHYNIYIYIGSRVPSNVLDILTKIKKLSLYDSFVNLSDTEIKHLENIYGELWYTKFFNSYHIYNTINQIRENKIQQKEIMEKFGEEWVKKHISSKELIERKLLYSYESIVKDDRLRKVVKKNKPVIEEESDLDFTIKKEQSQKNSSSSTEYPLSGGDNNLTDIDKLMLDISGFQQNYQIGGQEEQSEPQHDEFEQGLESTDLLPEEDVDLEEIGKLYQEVDVQPDENIKSTTNLLEKALGDDKLIEKTNEEIIQFDTSKDNDMYDESLKDIYNKYYVTSQYIFKDDTIKNIRNKICAGIKNNEKFGQTSYIIPSRQYLWSEYVFNNKIQKAMLGQKIMRRNELLPIDIEPFSNFRYYEELKGSLKLLRDSIKRHGSKIVREDDDNNILFDYEGYYNNNELFLIDVYNELGKNYNPDQETLRNISDVFLYLYFPKIKSDIKNIIDYLNSDPKLENIKVQTTYDIILNDLIMENEVVDIVEKAKTDKGYKKVVKDNYITQSTIHVNLRLTSGTGIGTGTKIDLFKIFDEFETTSEYPFIQYQKPDGQIIFKFDISEITEYLKKKENSNIIGTWFENAPYGISFKIKYFEKNVYRFMAIGLNENGRIEYKTQWKEEDMATIDDIKRTYDHVRNLIKKINTGKSKIKFDNPEDSEFKYAFINTIQKFELPEKFTINHNDLSDFSRYFYPYVSVVIEPRKRQAKIQKGEEKSKYGTYLRYKRVMKYENQSRIEQRILYFMRNYDYNDQSLANEISKQFNMTTERAFEEIEKVRTRVPNIKRSRKVLKKLENIPKYKPPGIGVDIQGKQRDRYKIRISGARDKNQLDRIINFINILMHLYIETYLYKKKDKQILKEKLKKLTNIAKRRNKVDNIVDYSKEIKTVKQMIKMDKQRIGFKPEKGQSQWTRACQNSGTDKKRRPQQFTSRNIDDLLKSGYSLNKKTGMYERKVILKEKGKKKEHLIHAVSLQEQDNNGIPTGNEIYYACSPEENSDHIYVGFLTKSKNPSGQCMPCCFKKDPSTSKNKEKQDKFMKCIGKVSNETTTDEKKLTGEKLYILLDTNKIQDGRFGFLPRYLEFYFNYNLGKDKKIRNHYLLETKTGYFFKYGSKQDNYQFLNAISSLFDLNIDDIKNRIISMLENDKNDLIFTSLNNGDIKAQFGTKDKFIDFIKLSSYLDYDLLNNILSIPGTLHKNGINIIVFIKKTIVVKKKLEKEKIKEDFYLECHDADNIFNIINPKRHTVFILKEHKYYYPIVLVTKENEITKDLTVTKTFNYADDPKNVVSHLLDFYKRSCINNFMDDVVYKNVSLTARTLYHKLHQLGTKKYMPKYQIIDVRNKCKYIITQDKTIIPCRPSGSIYNLQILKNFEGYMLDIKETLKRLDEIYTLTSKEIPVKPVGLYYDKIDDNTLHVVSVMTKTRDIVPVIESDVTREFAKSNNLLIENKPLTDKIDKELMKGKDNYVIDDRITAVNKDKYLSESYEIFRLEFSEFINLPENTAIKKKIEKIISDNTDKQSKETLLKSLLYKLIDKTLFDISNDVTTSKPDHLEGGKYDKFVHVTSKLPNLSHYQINNERTACQELNTKDQCSTDPHCHWTHSGCLISLTREMIIKFVSKISDELASNDTNAFEIMKIHNYFVSDVVSYDKFTERTGQRVIKSTSSTIKKILGELFGKENIPIIGKRRSIKGTDTNYQQLNMDNPLRDMGDSYVQKIIEHNLSYLRAYVNAFFWNKMPEYEIENRNLGYYSPVQTDVATYFRSLITDWLRDTKNYDEIMKNLLTYLEPKHNSKSVINDYIIKINNTVLTLTTGIVELYILNKLHNIPIIVHNDNNNIIYIFDNGIVFNLRNKDNINDTKYEIYLKNEGMKKALNMRFNFSANKVIPEEIEVIYYK